MGGVEKGDGESASGGRLQDRLQAQILVSQVEVEDPFLSGQKGPHSNFPGEAGDLRGRGLGATGVRDGQFTHTDHLRNKDQVLADGSGEGGAGHPVRPREHEAGKPQPPQPTTFRQKLDGGAGDGVRAQESNERRGSGLGQFLEGGGRRPILESAFASRSRHVHVGIDEPRNRQSVSGVDDHEVREGKGEGRELFRPERHAAFPKQEIPLPGRLGTEDLRTADKDRGWPLR